MLYLFFYDTKRFVEVVKEFCANEATDFIKTGNPQSMPENMHEIAFEMTAYFKKYHDFLEAVCDKKFKFF